MEIYTTSIYTPEDDLLQTVVVELVIACHGD